MTTPETENVVKEVVWHAFPLPENKFEVLRNGEYDTTIVGIDKLEMYLRAKGVIGEEFNDLVRQMKEMKVGAKAVHHGKIGFR